MASPLLAGDRRALARAITLVENGGPAAAELLRELYPRAGRAVTIGVTGFPGAGKSSLVDQMIAAWRSSGWTVGVIAVDPSSAFSGGAILGDRVRMMRHADDAEVFIRSMATRGRLGGVSRATGEALDLMDAAGKDVVVVETVGVGQAEIEIAQLADATLVVLVPGMGDDIQAIKAGILEIADVFVINKADHEGAERLAAELEQMLALAENSRPRPPIVQTIAVRGEGVEQLLQAIQNHLNHEGQRQRRWRRRLDRAEARLTEAVSQALLQRVGAGEAGGERWRGAVERLALRQTDPYSAAEQIISAALAATGR